MIYESFAVVLCVIFICLHLSNVHERKMKFHSKLLDEGYEQAVEDGQVVWVLPEGMIEAKLQIGEQNLRAQESEQNFIKEMLDKGYQQQFVTVLDNQGNPTGVEELVWIPKSATEDSK